MELCSKNEYTKSESNSQQSNSIYRLLCIVFKERIYKIWKQFTTNPKQILCKLRLCSKNEYTKSESNSQPQWKPIIPLCDCVQRTNIQNLKAIHNAIRFRCNCWIIVFKERIYKIWKQFTTPHFSLKAFPPIVFKERIYKIWKQFTTGFPWNGLRRALCSKNEYTKSESNSQHHRQTPALGKIVFKERIYKIWKQFTTRCHRFYHWRKLCSKNEYTKSESNSQLIFHIMENLKNCVQRTNIQNLKAIHNTLLSVNMTVLIVFKERIYKIWKQFTTSRSSEDRPAQLCSKNEYTKSESNSQPILSVVVLEMYCVQRTNIQNLKAIHNAISRANFIAWLCSKNEYTKSESNSQLWKEKGFIFLYCVQRTNIQNLKAIHNGLMRTSMAYYIVFKERIYKIWKQFTTTIISCHSRIDCVQRTNIQNLKAIHNGFRSLIISCILCSKNEYTKSESNSQQDQSLCQFFAHFSCLAFSTL